MREFLGHAYGAFPGDDSFMMSSNPTSPSLRRRNFSTILPKTHPAACCEKRCERGHELFGFRGLFSVLHGLLGSNMISVFSILFVVS